MKRIISRRCFFMAALALAVPLPVLWLTKARAQDYGHAPLTTAAQPPIRIPSTDDGMVRNPFAVLNLAVPAQAEHHREIRTRKLLSDYSRTDDEKKRAGMLDELTNVVSEQFEYRQATREIELKQLEEHMRKLRDLHSRRAKDKDQIVRDRVRQLLRDVEGLGWGDDNRPRPRLRDPQDKGWGDDPNNKGSDSVAPVQTSPY
jgi:hypothetical protein